MELAQALVQLWQRKIWLVVGLVVAALAAFGSRELLKSKVYAAATTQMVVDSPQSALSNIAPDLAPLTTRAGIYAQLMTSPPAVDAIGRAAGIPGAAIAATGPPNAGPSQTAQQPAASSAPSGFKLLLNQDPSLPTIDVYTEAPTTRQAIALANGAVSGFASYLRSLERQGSVRPANRVAIRQLGSAAGGVVDPGASAKLSGLIAVGVLLIWCGMMLFIPRLRSALANQATASVARAAAAADGDHPDSLTAIHVASERGWHEEYANSEASHNPDPEPEANPAANGRSAAAHGPEQRPATNSGQQRAAANSNSKTSKSGKISRGRQQPPAGNSNEQRTAARISAQDRTPAVAKSPYRRHES